MTQYEHFLEYLLECFQIFAEESREKVEKLRNLSGVNGWCIQSD